MLKHKIVENIIKDTLHKKGLKYETVCKKLGLKKCDFFKCMAGERKLKTSEFMSLCIFLGLKIEDFS